MKKLKLLLTNQQLTILHEKINYLTHLNQLWHKIVPHEFKAYTKIGNYQDGELILLTPHAGWATRMRYEIPSLLELLRTYPEFGEIESIFCKISDVPPYEKTLEKPHPTRSLSRKAAKIILKTAKQLKDSPLKAALMRLASNSSS